jgi:arginase
MAKPPIAKVALIPYASSLGAPVSGCEKAPELLRSGNLIQQLSQVRVDASWWPGMDAWENLYTPPLGSHTRNFLVKEYLEDLCANVCDAVHANLTPVVIGGDHSVVIGSLGGFVEATGAYGKTGLIWIDAHLDANTPSTSPSQAIFGMGLATVLGHGDVQFTAIGGARAKINPQHCCVIGMRNYDDGEIALLEELGVAVFTTDDIIKMGPETVMQRAMGIVSDGTLYHYLSLDIDVLDPAFAPGVNAPEPGGISRAELEEMLAILFDTLVVHAMDIAEFNPTRDKNQQTERLVHDILVQCLKRL